MQHLDVTDDQLAYLERVRATLESEYLGPYGTVNIQDALQYLIDVHEATAPEMPRADAGVVAAATASGAVQPSESVPTTNGAEPSSSTAAVETPDEPTEESASESVAENSDTTSVEPDEAATEPTEEDAASESSGAVEAGGAERADVDEPDGSDDTATEDEPTEETTVDDTADGADDVDEGSSDDAAAAPGPGGNDRLQAMMNLLDTHGDKWREGDGEARYEVDLPDGSVETVQTRDDVRAVLFKNYR